MLFAFLAILFPITSLALLQHASLPSAYTEIFSNVTEQAGIVWRHFSGESPDRFLIETMGGGVAFLDFDADGLQDLFFVNGGETPRTKSLSSVRNALYRNIGNGKFEDVSAKAGVDRVEFYGMGVAVGDFDNDGFPDLYVSGFPSSALFHNNGNGTFTDVTARAGVKNAGRWAASAAWFDFDQDGYLDLVVTNYARFSFNEIKKCELNSVRSYCEQKSYPGMPLTLFRNNGNGTFMDVSEKSGVAKLVGRALGVVAIDVNDDGWPDLFVARDASPNLLLINKRNGTFEDSALEAELAAFCGARHAVSAASGEIGVYNRAASDSGTGWMLDGGNKADFSFNAKYGTGDQVQGQPVGRTLLDEEMVLFRADGRVAALHDLCVHRGTPLSLGSLQGSNIVCAYHGWTYNGEGVCVRIPSVPPDRAIPEKARVASYRTAERYGLVWVCLDEASSSIPEFPELEDEDIRQALTYTATYLDDRIVEWPPHYETAA